MTLAADFAGIAGQATNNGVAPPGAVMFATFTSAPTGGAETRPRNIAFPAFIKL